MIPESMFSGGVYPGLSVIPEYDDTWVEQPGGYKCYRIVGHKDVKVEKKFLGIFRYYVIEEKTIFCRGTIKTYHEPEKIKGLGGQYISKCNKCGYIDDAGIYFGSKFKNEEGSCTTTLQLEE